MNITSLSPSMVNLYNQCPYKFYCSYCLQLPRMGSAYTAYGCAFHAMAEENFFQKVNTHQDLPIDLLLDFFRDGLQYRDDVDWKDRPESLDDMKDQGVKTVKAYMLNVAPGIQPKLVEHQWSMEIKNRPWAITGKIDLIEDDGNDGDGGDVYELKTANKLPAKPRNGSPPKPKGDHDFQVSTYVMGRRAETGRSDVQGRIHYGLRGSDKSMTLPLSYGDDLAQKVVSSFDYVAKCIQREWWPVFRSHYLCSRKYCSFWETCQDDNGGEVEK